MGWFKSNDPTPVENVSTPVTAASTTQSSIPISQIDSEKRYDVYCLIAYEERLYENIRFVGLRQLDQVTEFSTGYSTFVEIEFPDATRIMIPQYSIHTICERGIQPKYQVLKQHGSYY